MKKITLLVFVILLNSGLLTAQTTFNKTQTLTLTGTEGDAPYPIAAGDIDNDGFIMTL